MVKKLETVVIPIDKTNKFLTVNVDNYINWMHNHITKCGVETQRSKLIEIYKKLLTLLEKMQRLIDKNEYLFILEKLLTQGIPTPLLLIKNHKRKDNKGNFPTRIVVPATNFMAGFAKLGYLGIKKIFKESKIIFF